MDHDMIYIVSGLPRSGTSLMMKMLEKGGIEPLTDNIRTADDDNPRGYYELERVKKLPEDSTWLPDAKGKVVKVLAELIKHLVSIGGWNFVLIFAPGRTHRNPFYGQKPLVIDSAHANGPFLKR